MQYENWFCWQVQKASPDLLVIMLGTNDIFYNIDPTADLIVTRMEGMIQYTKENHLSEDTLLLSCPGLGMPEVDQQSILEGISRGFLGIADKEKIGFADPLRWDIPLSFDGVHFSEEGHRYFAEKMDKVIKEYYR